MSDCLGCHEDPDMVGDRDGVEGAVLPGKVTGIALSHVKAMRGDLRRVGLARCLDRGAAVIEPGGMVDDLEGRRRGRDERRGVRRVAERDHERARPANLVGQCGASGEQRCKPDRGGAPVRLGRTSGRNGR